ncbi:MAG: phospholipase D-like domain-containing protein [Deltaproteobacteria bacterium]|nr:phospholipase D-like domain-containing protein [Deltaproteobacteria bacterium]
MTHCRPFAYPTNATPATQRREATELAQRRRPPWLGAPGAPPAAIHLGAVVGAPSIARPGRNCWRVEPAERVAVLVDGAAYFSAFAAAARRARHHILLIGWDFHGGVRLHPDGRPDRADEIGTFLEELVVATPTLRVSVLDWDFSLLYALERQFLPRLRFGQLTHERFRFRLDSHHPPAGAQHQKIAVIDDALAFVGGFDFGPCRWDTVAHDATDARRVDPDGRPYPPFHDVQIAVDGGAARAVAAMARQRWEQATGEPLAASPPDVDVWPADVRPDFEQVDVAIARTQPAFDGNPEVREVEQLYLDAIAAARRWLYFENQYLTSDAIGAALIRRLAEPDGPEVVILQPRQCQGWVEQTAMGVLRARLMRRLRAADRFDRLRVYYPDVAGLGEQRLTVHAKLLVVDDRLLRIGSANLNNRSMGVDSECDLAIEAGADAERARRIAAVRDRLVGEHVGHSAERVAATLAAHGSLIRTIETLSSPQRGLRPLATEVEAWLDRLVPDAALLDPPRPMFGDRLLARWGRPRDRGPRRRRAIWNAALTAGAAMTGAAARWLRHLKPVGRGA